MGAVAVAALWVAYSVGMWGYTLLRGYCVTPADIVSPSFPSRAAHWAGSEVPPPQTQAVTTPLTPPVTTPPVTPGALPAGPSAGRPGSPAGVGAGNLPGTPVTGPGPGGVTLV